MHCSVPCTVVEAGLAEYCKVIEQRKEVKLYSPSCKVEMNHGQGKAVNDFLLAMLKMMLAPYLQAC